MTNKCDLKEMKALALKKFCELAENPENWKDYCLYKQYNTYYFGNNFNCGDFYFSERYVGGLGRVIEINLGNEEIAWIAEPRSNNLPRNNKTGELTAKAQKQYNDEVKEYNARPEVIAVKRIIDYFAEKRCEEHRAKMQKQMEESCQAIQKALKEEEVRPQMEAWEEAYPKLPKWQPWKKQWWKDLFNGG